MKRKILLILCTLPSWANAQTVQVLDSVVSYRDGGSGVKYEYQYDAKGIAISETSYYWDNSSNAWVGIGKSDYQYDGANNKTWTTYNWDVASNTWVENRKYSYLYNNLDNQTWITYYWNAASNTWIENKKYDYQYNAGNNQSVEIFYVWDNAWTEISTVQYDYRYSTIPVNNSIQPVAGVQPVTVFPNPATNCITVKGATESVITVSSLSGINIYNRVMASASENIDVSSWASGTYLISVETGNNKTVSKIIKK